MARFPFLKILLLNFIEKEGKTTGYDFLKYCKKENITASPGTVYPQLEALAKDGILEKKVDGRKNVYFLTKKGKGFLKEIQKSKEGFKNIMSKLGVVMENPQTSMPKSIQKSFRAFFYSLHSVNWKREKDVENFLKEFERVESEIRRWLNERKSDKS
ncbi:PadR family transcriptional regulator [Mesoaciditoga lauensis]|uniref:PadR family transcriptional regulator n=1 Tax=Mesoaciditoga lauensis TaxID=1495039 RepID=UPI00056C9BA8|nr:PadR family transcriptional regulator [Mesoaciditoga lauensis]